MEVKIIKSKFLNNLFDQNTYVLIKNNNAIIIDAGAELDDVLNVLGSAKVHAILMTHLHFDHFWNIEDYIEKFKCDIFIKEGAFEKFSNAKLNGSVLMKKEVFRNVDKKYIKFYQNKLKIADFLIDVYFTPGHSSDCVCLKIENALFSGDTIFSSGVGRTDLCDSDDEQMKKSLKLIKSLDFEDLYPGHYNSTKKLKADNVINYFLLK